MTMYIEGFLFIRNSTVASFIPSTSPARVCCICNSSADEKHKHKLGLDTQRLERVLFSFREVIWKKNEQSHSPTFPLIAFLTCNISSRILPVCAQDIFVSHSTMLLQCLLSFGLKNSIFHFT